MRSLIDLWMRMGEGAHFALDSYGITLEWLAKSIPVFNFSDEAYMSIRFDEVSNSDPKSLPKMFFCIIDVTNSKRIEIELKNPVIKPIFLDFEVKAEA